MNKMYLAQGYTGMSQSGDAVGLPSKCFYCNLDSPQDLQISDIMTPSTLGLSRAGLNIPLAEHSSYMPCA